MFFSKSCEYALRATMYLAKAKVHERVGIKVISKSLNLPPDYLNKVMQLLVKSDLVSSVRGRNGGFYLTQNERNEPLIKIVHAIDGEVIFRKCGLGIDNCSSKKPCPLHNEIKAYRDNIKLALSNNSIGSTLDDIEGGVTFLSR